MKRVVRKATLREMPFIKKVAEKGVLELYKYDWPAIEGSVRKTGRVIVAYEDARTWGYGAEVAARIGDELFEYLDAPVQRVAALDTFVGYHPQLEDATLPQVADILQAIRSIRAY